MVFDKGIIDKHPEVQDSTAEKNGNMCQVMFCDFEDPKDEGADPDMEPISMSCGH